MVSRLSDEQIEKNKDKIENFISTFPKDRRDKVNEMFAGAVGLEYYTAPASAREDYHNCFPGGLAEHSIRVTENLHNIAKSFKAKFDPAVLNFVGLFHDFGKIGDGIEPYYIPNKSQWHREKGMLYEVNKACVYMPTSERGLYVLQRYGIILNSDEWLAIRLNDGMYDETNKRYAMKEPDLALLVHMADRWSCSQEKRSE